MLTIIHGDNIEASRNQLQTLKSEVRSREIRELSGKKIDPVAFLQATQSSSLFGEPVIVICENILTSANKREKGFVKLISAIVDAAKSCDLWLYEEKPVDAVLLTKLGAGKIYEFKTPVLIFRFLDGLTPKNTTGEIGLLTQLLVHEPAEIVFTMLVRRVRQLIQLTDGVSPEGLADWQANRLTGQARSFTMEQLVAMHTTLTEMDVAIKTGTSPFTLSQLLAQFVLSL